MSNYIQWTKHPNTGRWENAMWIDDWFGRHRYGVKFPSGRSVYDPSQCIVSINEEEAMILNEHKSAYPNNPCIVCGEKYPKCSGGRTKQCNNAY